MTLATFSISANARDADTDAYENCIRQYPCELDGKDLSYISKEKRDVILRCRLDRHMKCVVPDESTGFVLDPVYEYYKIYGEYL